MERCTIGSKYFKGKRMTKPTPDSKFHFGQQVKDKLTGFTGKLTTYCTYEFDPPKWAITMVSKDGSESKDMYVVENRIEPIS